MDDTFVQQVHDILQHLHDYPYLQTHPLLATLAPDADMAPRERMRALRTLILSAINELHPGGAVPMRSPQARTYNVLNLRYVVGMTVEAAARELAVSDRQFYRDLRKAEQDLAALLWTRRPEATPARLPKTEQTRNDLVQQEFDRIGSSIEDVDLQVLLDGVMAAVHPLSQQLGVRVETSIPATLLSISTDRLLARQILVGVVSHAVQNAAGSTVQLAAQRRGARVCVRLSYQRRQSDGDVLPQAAESLLRRIDADCQTAARPDGHVTLTLLLGMRAQTAVLVIDDNEALVELFRRYLAEENVRLMVAYSGRDGLRLAEEALPDIILLDVMMPQEDGWEVLQVLHNKEQTKNIPVIVCSVLNDPQLALSLGAVDCLVKPVSRVQLLAALARYRRDTAPRSHPATPADRQ